MKKIKLLALSAVSAVPLMALPLINATTTTAQAVKTALSSTTNEETEVIEQDIPGTTATSKFKFTLHTDGDTKYSALTYITLNESFDKLKIPAYPTGYPDYPLKQITLNNAIYSNNASNEINLLDFSAATNLEIIHEYSFDSNDHKASGSKMYKIRWVNFRGAINLKVIQQRVFKSQWFSNEISGRDAILDLSSTQITDIGYEAFCRCCDDDKNEFKGIIFPSTLKAINERAFIWDDENNGMKFDFMIFNTPASAVTTSMFDTKALPYATSDKTRVICPYGTKDTYTADGMKYTTASEGYITSKDKWQESNITYINCGGSTALYSEKGTAGQDTKTWVPKHTQTGLEVENATLYIDHGSDATFSEGQIYLDSTDHKIHWTNDLPVGTYKFKVVALYTSDGTTEGYITGVVSDTITLTVTDGAYIDGGDTRMNGNYYASGESQNAWVTHVPGCTVSSVQYTLLNTGSIISKLHVNSTDGKTCTIKWDAGIPANEYTFKIHAVISTVEVGTTYTVEQQVTLKIDGNYYKLGLYDKKYGDTGYSEVDNIELNKQDSNKKIGEYHIQTFVDSSAKQGTYQLPKLSLPQEIIEKGFAIAPSGNDDGDYTLTIDSTNLTPGSYEFYIQADSAASNGYEVYTSRHTLVVKDSSLTLPTLDVYGSDQEITTVKKHASSNQYLWEVEPSLSGWNIGSATTVMSPWEKTAGGERSSNITVTPLSGKQFSLSWNEKMSTDTSVSDDVYDFSIQLTLTNAASNDEMLLLLPITITSESYGEIDTNTPTIINGYGNTSHTTADYIFKMNINGAPSSSAHNIAYTVTPEDTAIADKIRFVEKTSNEFYLVWDDTISAGQYALDVTALDKNSGISATKKYILNLTNELALTQYPTVLKSYLNQEYGFAEDRFKFNFNGVEAEKSDFAKIEVLCDGVATDKVYLDNDLYARWNGTEWAVGTYSITFNFTHKTGLTKSITIPMISQQSPETEKPVRIVVTNKPTKVNYQLGEGFVSDGIVVTGYTADNLPVSLTKGQYVLSVADGEKLMTAGEKSITVTYSGLSTTFTVTVDDTDPDPSSIDGIKVLKKPLKKDYVTGEALDLQGLEVSLLFKNGTAKEIYNYTTDIRDGEVLTKAGAQTITVTYGTFTTSFGINVTKSSSSGSTTAAIVVGSIGGALGLAGVAASAVTLINMNKKKKADKK